MSRVSIAPSGSRLDTKGTHAVVMIGVRRRCVGRDNGARRHLGLLAGLQYEDSANFASTEF